MNVKGTGHLGEKLVCNFLQKQHFRILHTNWTCQWGEIDLIAEKSGIIHFVEVKTRFSSNFGLAYENFTWKKRSHLIRAIHIYLSKNNLENARWQLDLYCVEKYKSSLRITSYLNV